MTLTRGKSTAATFLDLKLFEPGMGPFHRAGLGGLACALRFIEMRHAHLATEDIPGHPWHHGAPWQVEPDRIRLEFSKPEQAGEFLKRLFEATFQLSSGFIYLPCLYDSLPSQEVLAEQQRGLTLTFLQHGKSRDLAKEEQTLTYEVEPGQPPVAVEYKRCTGYKHQEQWKVLVDKKGKLSEKNIEVSGPILPGAVVRHVAYSADTKVTESAGRFLALCFSLVGTLSIPIHKGKAILLIPEVTNLVEFAQDRPLLSPRTFRELRASGEGDAVLQALLRLRAARVARSYELPGFYSMSLQSTPWASQQKSRVSTLHIRRGLSTALALFAKAWQSMPDRLIQRKDGSNSFLRGSLARQLFAQNLASERVFYEGFTSLMIASHEETSFERKGLNSFMDSAVLSEGSPEATIVRAVHLALRGRYAEIARDTGGNPVGMRKRFRNEYDRWRLAFSGAKTAEQVRHHLCDLFSRGGPNSALRQSWLTVLPQLVGPEWRLSRDLVLLALCSYTGRGAESEGSETDGEGDNQ